MTTTPDIEAIVAKLTKAQRDAVMGIYSFASPMEEEDGEETLIVNGLWNELYGGKQRITPLGLLVKAHLQSERKDR
jgi:hypothetical protein